MQSQFTELRATQFPQLGPGKAYLDWTGAAQPPAMLIENWCRYLKETAFGNPHSNHTPSLIASVEIDKTRRAVLKYFNASPDEYDVIFTSGATGAIRLLENYVFSGGELLLTVDNHNSVHGLRQSAKRSGALTRYSPINKDLKINETALQRMLSNPHTEGNRLFGYPAKSNFAGTIHSPAWVQYAQENGWDVLLDAAAYLGNRRLDLGHVKPEFVPVSFYKMFGFPTGVGCLIIKKSAYRRLNKAHFAGGSILMVGVNADVAIQEFGHAGFEDGTQNFAMIPAVQAGLEFIDSLEDVTGHAVGLASHLYDGLYQIENQRGHVRIYSARGNDTVTFSVIDGKGKMVNPAEFEKAVNQRGVYVRSGCFCNPGVAEVIFNYDADEFAETLLAEIRQHPDNFCHPHELFGGNGIGAIRASLGYANNLDDCRALIQATETFINGL